MESSVSKVFILLLSTALLLGAELIQCTVTYDSKAIIINGQRRILISGSMHYPRSTPDMWEGLMKKAKDGGLDVIDTYVFWSGHEPSQGNYNFEGSYDLVKFVQTAQKLGLYVSLRIGPYVCAEWNLGGFPVWLKFVPGISFRTDNQPFKEAMQGFTQKIVQLMQSENLFEPQGGPIIMSQIENEYGGLVKVLGAPGNAYMNWAANMAVGLNTGVPWVMCKEPDAPDPVINTVNGFYCDTFKPNKPYKPTMWTEAWTGWFSEFGEASHKRPVKDLAFAVARFVQRGGSLINYYMYHGGTNFGRTAGGPFVTTSYDYDAPIDEYGLIRDPKYGHLKELHKAIKQCEPALVSSDPTVINLGHDQLAIVFTGQGTCAAFLSNSNTESEASVMFNNTRHKLPPWSVSILPDCRNSVFNTAMIAKVITQTPQQQMVPTNTMMLSWETYGEDISSLEESSTMTAIGLLEQINVTRDSSDYLWYMTRSWKMIEPPYWWFGEMLTVFVAMSTYYNSIESYNPTGGKMPTLSMVSQGHAAHVFINGQLSGSAYGTREAMMFKFTGSVNLRAGMNSIALLSIAVGLPNLGLHFETWKAGILGPVSLHGLDHGVAHLSWQTWTYKVGMKGEAMNLASPNTVSSVEWIQVASDSKGQNALSWYRAYFDAPKGNEPLALDLRSMGKGQAWINGQSIGRYWSVNAYGNCSTCSYVGVHRKTKCQIGCGKPTQRWYHVPRSWLQPKNNLLVLFEELGGDLFQISLVKRTSS